MRSLRTTRRRTEPDELGRGLGNPGREHAGTRHNVGFEVMDRLARPHHVSWPAKLDGRALEARWRRPDADVLFVKPLTYMNLSGRAIGELSRFYKVDLPDVLDRV